MTLKRSIAGVLASAALVSAAFAAPASAEDAAGSATVPIGTVGTSCYKYITVWWDTSKPVPAGTSGRVTC